MASTPSFGRPAAGAGNGPRPRCTRWVRGSLTPTTALGLLVLAGLGLALPAAAAKDALPRLDPPDSRSCPFQTIEHDWDFAVSPHGFFNIDCDASGVQVWEYGATSSVPGAPARVWGTILNGPYPDESGAGLVSPTFTVSPSSYLVEVEHWYETEWGYDGCNLTIWPYGTVVTPMGGYPLGVISESPYYYAWCVDGEPGWSGSSGGWRVDCFDLSEYMNMSIAVELDFGADASVTTTGWYLARIRVGGDSPVEGACCLEGGLCRLRTAVDCADMGGWFVGGGTTCTPNPCPYIPGACCLAGGVCQVLTLRDCGELYGDFQGHGTTCDPNPCPPPMGACCLPGGACLVATYNACLDTNGWYLGDGTTCDPYPCGPLAPPDSLRVEALGPNLTLVTWLDTNPGEDEYRIDRKEGLAGQWQTVQIVPANSTAWLDPGVIEGRNYYYRVRAARGGELSLFSNYYVVIAGQPPAAPSNLLATPGGPTSVNLSWLDHADNEMGFVLQFKRGEFGAWQNLEPSRPANQQYATHQNAQPASIYQYRIRSYNFFGSSAWAVSPLCTTPADPGSFGALIWVRHRGQTIPGAKIELRHLGGSFTQVAVTDSSGSAYVAGLRLADRLRATWVAHEWTTCREYRQYEPHNDMGMQLWIDSDVMDDWGNYSSFSLAAVAPEYSLDLVHSIYRFDLAMAVEWDMTPTDPFWNQLNLACQEASDYLYDASDGQMALRRIAVWDNQCLWDEVDVQIVPSQHPKADCDQFMDCDSWSSNEHIFLGRTAYGDEPPHPDWFSSLIHEFGHYGLGLRDEYETAWGGQAQMDKQKLTYPHLYPRNFGVMDDQLSLPEMSSVNDYPTNFDYGVSGMARLWWWSEQLMDRGKPTWTDVAGTLESWCSLADITVPQAGWFVAGASTSPDRLGPNVDLGLVSFYAEDIDLVRERPPIDFQTFDSGPGSFADEVEIHDDAGPVGGARVYRWSGGRLVLLGQTDPRGRVTAVGLKPGDRLRAYGRTRAGALAAQTDAIAAPSAERLRVDIAATGREEAPGAAVDVIPTGTPESPFLLLDLWADETLAEAPRIVAFCAVQTETLAVQHAGANRYQARYALPVSSPGFDGRGLFEVRLIDLLANTSTFTTPFVVDLTTAHTHVEIEPGASNFNVLRECIEIEQLHAGAESNTVPYRAPGQDLLPVGDVCAFHLAAVEQYPLAATINIAYDDSLLGGIDERTLGIYRWDPEGLQWLPLATSLVSTGSNVASATVGQGGVFCLFATEANSDFIPPDRIQDLGAAGIPGQGAVDLLWSATGDDGALGAAQDYVVAYSESLFTEEEVDGLPQIVVPGDATPSGVELTTTLHLPREGQLYYFGVRAKDEASNLSLLSNVTYAITGIADPNFVAAPPTDVRAVDAPADTGCAVQITWQLSYDDGNGKHTVVAYNIHRTQPESPVPDSIASVPAGTTVYLDATAENGRDYAYWVSAVEPGRETMGAENRAFAARNLGMPPGDFTSDRITGIDDFALFTEAFGRDALDLEFEPLFDLVPDDEISQADFQTFGLAFGAGGSPSSDPPGENEDAIVASEVVPGTGSLWHLNLFVRDASNLAGYSFRVDYPHQTLALIEATPDSAGTVTSFLNQDGGVTPLFLVAPGNPAPGSVQIANVIQRASPVTAPEGDGFLARLTFSGTGASQITVTDVVLMDAQRLLNYRSGTSSVEDAYAILRPHLYWSIPNPFRAQTVIRFQVPARQSVTLAVYDVAGRLVRKLIDGPVDPGLHSVSWDGRCETGERVACGVYFDRFETAGYTQTRKVALVR